MCVLRRRTPPWRRGDKPGKKRKEDEDQSKGTHSGRKRCMLGAWHARRRYNLAAAMFQRVQPLGADQNKGIWTPSTGRTAWQQQPIFSSELAVPWHLSILSEHVGKHCGLAPRLIDICCICCRIVCSCDGKSNRREFQSLLAIAIEELPGRAVACAEGRQTSLDGRCVCCS